jgi:hypothetical protein
MSEEAIRALKPWRVVHLDWRGGRITAVADETITIELRAEQSIIRSYVVALALYPEAAEGAAVICKIANPGAGTDSYIISEVRGASFCGYGHSSAAPSWGHIAYEMFGEDPYWPWSKE